MRAARHAGLPAQRARQVGRSGQLNTPGEEYGSGKGQPIRDGQRAAARRARALLPARALDALGHAVRDCTGATVAATGEPVVATYTPDEAAGLLSEAGFGRAELFDAGRLRDRYLRNRPDLPLPGTTLIAVATT